MNRHLHLVAALAAALGLLAACAAEPTEPAAPTTSGVTAGAAADGVLEASEDQPNTPVDTESLGSVGLVPEPELMVRARQRMNLDQLSAAIVQATDGIGWTELQGNNEVDLFEQLAATLGKPDYIEITQEDLSASALFHKFLDDAARDVCTRLVERELSAPSAPRALMVHVEPDDTLAEAPEAVDDNLTYLLLRYHGRTLATDAPELNAWRWLFESVSHGAQDPTAGWRAVCVALITHPHFYSY